MLSQSFSDRVVELARSVPSGRVTTYGDLARAAGALSYRNCPLDGPHASRRSHKSSSSLAGAPRAPSPRAAQSITSILAKAYDKGIKDIPFHRIVYSNGKIWVNESHRKERMKLYKKEGIKIDQKDKVVDFDKLRV